VRVLAVSPHLDDAVFSVGGTLAALTDAGHDVTVLTCFTGSVPDPTGFALACQLDKGLAADVDYMALRRAEDDTATALLGASNAHLGLLEAPHPAPASRRRSPRGAAPGSRRRGAAPCPAGRPARSRSGRGRCG